MSPDFRLPELLHVEERVAVGHREADDDNVGSVENKAVHAVVTLTSIVRRAWRVIFKSVTYTLKFLTFLIGFRAISKLKLTEVNFGVFAFQNSQI